MTVTVTVNFGRTATPTDPIYLTGDGNWTSGGPRTSGTSYSLSSLAAGVGSHTYGAYDATNAGTIMTITVGKQSGTGNITQASILGRTSPSNAVSANIQTVTGQYKYNIRNMTTPQNYPYDGPYTGNSPSAVTNAHYSTNSISIIEFFNLAGSATSLTESPDTSCDTTTTTGAPTTTTTGAPTTTTTSEPTTTTTTSEPTTTTTSAVTTTTTSEPTTTTTSEPTTTTTSAVTTTTTSQTTCNDYYLESDDNQDPAYFDYTGCDGTPLTAGPITSPQCIQARSDGPPEVNDTGGGGTVGTCPVTTTTTSAVTTTTTSAVTTTTTSQTTCNDYYLESDDNQDPAYFDYTGCDGTPLTAGPITSPQCIQARSDGPPEVNDTGGGGTVGTCPGTTTTTSAVTTTTTPVPTPPPYP